MQTFRIAMVLFALIAVEAAVSTAHAAFSGNACGLLSAKQVATVHVTPLKCTSQKTFSSSVATNYPANWGGTGVAPHLAIVVILYKSNSYFQLAKNNLKIGYTTKVSGIGNSAYESHSGVLAQVSFAVGHYIVALNLRTSKPLKSVAPFNKLAMTIAGEI